MKKQLQLNFGHHNVIANTWTFCGLILVIAIFVVSFPILLIWLIM